MFDDWLASELRAYAGDHVTVETDTDRLPRIEGQLIHVAPAYIALAQGDRLIYVRAEHVVAVRLPNVEEPPAASAEETSQP